MSNYNFQQCIKFTILISTRNQSLCSFRTNIKSYQQSVSTCKRSDRFFLQTSL